ncbi:MAG: SDR family NAD(P)-dependent oxidoreductase [Planctomycetota bacterium]
MRWNARDSVAIVTGASSGIGFELSLRLVQSGCHVVAVARRENRLNALVETARQRPSRQQQRYDAQVVPVVGDVTREADRQRAFSVADQIGDGRLDLLVNNAGIGAIGRFDEASEHRLRRVMEVNFFAPTQWTRDAISRMSHSSQHASRRNAPVICNIGSVLGHRAVPDKSEYCASKFALHGWNDSLRTELASQGITVTLVSPSTTQSEFFDTLVETDANVRSKSFGQWPASRVARATLAAIRSRRSEVILSLGGKALVYADRLAPPLVSAVLTLGVEAEA